MTTGYVVAAVGAVGLLSVAIIVVVLRVYLRYRGKRLITCPESGTTVALDLDARLAAATSPLHRPVLRVKDCSHWPERRDCDQKCLGQIESAPERCLVRNIVSEWYRGRVCAFCGRAFGDLNWLDHQPALVDPGGRTVLWRDVPADRLPDVLSAFRPACWDCHIAETFRREHPELVVDRPSHRDRPPAGS